MQQYSSSYPYKPLPSTHSSRKWTQIAGTQKRTLVSLRRQFPRVAGSTMATSMRAAPFLPFMCTLSKSPILTLRKWEKLYWKFLSFFSIQWGFCDLFVWLIFDIEYWKDYTVIDQFKGGERERKRQMSVWLHPHDISFKLGGVGIEK